MINSVVPKVRGPPQRGLLALVCVCVCVPGLRKPKVGSDSNTRKTVNNLLHSGCIREVKHDCSCEDIKKIPRFITTGFTSLFILLFSHDKTLRLMNECC